MTKSPLRVPARVSFPEPAGRLEAWGWLREVGACGARLVCVSELRRGELVEVSFEVAGEPFEKLSSRVRWSARDEDGHWDAELSFTDELSRRRLARFLLELLARG